jgi:hypothetical protein
MAMLNLVVVCAKVESKLAGEGGLKDGNGGYRSSLVVRSQGWQRRDWARDKPLWRRWAAWL